MHTHVNETVDDSAVRHRRRRGGIALMAIGAVIALLIGFAPGASANPDTTIASDPTPSLGGGTWGDLTTPDTGSGALDSGDTIVYGDDARVVIDGPAGPVERDRAAAASALPSAVGGYQLIHPSLGINPNYQIRLVTDHPSWMSMSPLVLQAITQLNAATGATYTLGSPRSDHTPALSNEISISMYTSPPCTGDFVGCTDAHTWSWNGNAPYFISAARIWIDPGFLASPEIFSEILLHELGHAAGLDHYDASFEGLPQVMRSFLDLPLVGSYRSGDRNGLAQTAAIGALVPGPCLPGVIDVGVDNPFCGDITWAIEKAIATGYLDGTFRPLVTLSRQAAAAFLYRLAGSPPVPDTAPLFSDVGPDHPFRDAIRWMASEGISTGYLDGTFQPLGNLSRQAMASFLHRMAAPTPVPYLPTFHDVGADHQFFTAISWLAEAGITAGDLNGGFNPTAALSRQAMAAFLHRYDALPTTPA